MLSRLVLIATACVTIATAATPPVQAQAQWLERAARATQRAAQQAAREAQRRVQQPGRTEAREEARSNAQRLRGQPVGATPAALASGSPRVRQLGPVQWEDRDQEWVRRVPFDEAEVIALARRDAQASTDKVACVQQASEDVDGFTRNGWNRGAVTAQPLVYQTIATGILCLEDAVAADDAAMQTLLQDRGTPLPALVSAMPAQFGRLGRVRFGEFWYAFSQAPRGSSKGAALHGLLSCPVSDNPRGCSTFSTRDDNWYALMGRFAGEVAATTDRTQLTALAAALLPFWNIETRAAADTLPLEDEFWRIRDTISRGGDPAAKARGKPSAREVHELLQLQADPTARAMLARRGTGVPEAREIAQLFADAYLRGERAAQPNLEGGAIGSRSWQFIGVTAVWSLPQGTVPNAAYGHEETITFMVHDMSGPECTKVAAGLRCRMKVRAEAGTDGLFPRLAQATQIFLQGGEMESDAGWQNREAARYMRRDYPWQEIEIDIAGTPGAWRSAMVDDGMAELARMQAVRRTAMGRQLQEANAERVRELQEGESFDEYIQRWEPILRN